MFPAKKISKFAKEKSFLNISKDKGDTFQPDRAALSVIPGTKTDDPSQTAVEPQSVLIALLTFQRSARLRRLLPHLVETLKSAHNVEILVVDNNALPNEQKSVESFARQTSYPVHYVHEPKAGVSNARNAALEFASSRFLAFLDDDMEITENWIDGLVKVAINHEAGVVFGPLVAKFDDAGNPKNAFLSSFYARHSKQLEEGITEEAFGTGGCLIDLKTCQLPNPPFDTRLNQSGGEDDIFFASLRGSGSLYGWSPSAICYECVPKERTTFKYVAKRNFGFGQGPSRIAASKGRGGVIQLARHMSVGCAQLCVYGMFYYLARLLNRPSEIRYLALGARGVGKILWFDRFRPKLYGGTLP